MSYRKLIRAKRGAVEVYVSGDGKRVGVDSDIELTPAKARRVLAALSEAIAAVERKTVGVK